MLYSLLYHKICFWFHLGCGGCWGWGWWVTALAHKTITSCHGSASYHRLKFIWKFEVEEIHIDIQTDQFHKLLNDLINYWDGGKAIENLKIFFFHSNQKQHMLNIFWRDSLGQVYLNLWFVVAVWESGKLSWQVHFS